MNGHAIGLGCTIALLCDYVVATEEARIGDPHVSIGLVAGDCGGALWAQRIGLGRTKEYLLTGEVLTADKAAAALPITNCAILGPTIERSYVRWHGLSLPKRQVP